MSLFNKINKRFKQEQRKEDSNIHNSTFSHIKVPHNLKFLTPEIAQTLLDQHAFNDHDYNGQINHVNNGINILLKEFITKQHNQQFLDYFSKEKEAIFHILSQLQSNQIGGGFTVDNESIKTYQEKITILRNQNKNNNKIKQKGVRKNLDGAFLPVVYHVEKVHNNRDYLQLLGKIIVFLDNIGIKVKTTFLGNILYTAGTLGTTNMGILMGPNIADRGWVILFIDSDKLLNTPSDKDPHMDSYIYSIKREWEKEEYASILSIMQHLRPGETLDEIFTNPPRDLRDLLL
ncbi:MAG TPA: hypothetical protein PK048_03230 [Candidatus Absconditabacterales bacterium]|nr:hypothetical protein [Candidatus Absconditabacterales bacterium]